MISLENIPSGIWVIIGGVLPIVFQYFFKKYEISYETRFEKKKERYLCIIMLAISFLEPEKRLKSLTLRRPELYSLDRLREELEAEYYNAFIYAEDIFIDAFFQFLNNPNFETYSHFVFCMRKDLWDRKSNVCPQKIV